MSQMEITPGLSTEETIKARHSVRKFNPDIQIPDETLNEILELAAAAPSSWNLQHWRFLVIKDQDRKDLITKIAYGQQQVSEASAVIIILGDLEADKTGHQIYKAAVDAGYLKPEVRDALLGQIDGAYKSDQIARDEAILNAGLASMQLMLAAKAKGYDSVPMGGYDKKKLIETLHIPARFIPIIIIPIGVAASPAHPSGRLPLDQLVINESF